jgi:hypothetical protein
MPIKKFNKTFNFFNRSFLLNIPLFVKTPFIIVWERRIFWGFFVFLVLVAGWLRFGHMQDPFIDPDTPAYLHPAISILTGNGFKHIKGVNFLYPGFVYVLLSVFRDFRSIPVVQHLLGLACAIFLAISLLRVHPLLGKQGVPAPILRWVVLVASAAYALSPTQIYREQMIRPDAIFPFMVMLNIYFTVEFLRARILKERNPVGWGMALIFGLCVSFCLKPHFILTCFFATLPVIISLFMPGEKWWRKAMMILVPSGLAVALLFVPEARLSRKDSMAKLFGPQTLFCIHADLIQNQMADDIAARSFGPYGEELISKVQTRLNLEVERSKPTKSFNFKALDFNPDYLMYNGSICPDIHRYFSYDTDAVCKFYWHWYLRTWVKQPWAMTEKVLRQMREFYTIPNRLAYRHQSENFMRYYYGSAEYLETNYKKIFCVMSQLPMVGAFIQRTTALKSKPYILESPKWMNLIWKTLEVTYLPIVLICLGLAIRCGFYPELRRHFLRGAIVTVFFFGYNFSNCLGISIMHCLSVIRYVDVQMVFTTFSHALGILFIFSMGRFWWQKFTKSQLISA